MSYDLSSARNYIIQIELSQSNGLGKRVDINTVKRMLDGTGIELDSNYGPHCINPQQRRFVVRGVATNEARRLAEQRFGNEVKFFADSRVEAISAQRK